MSAVRLRRRAGMPALDLIEEAIVLLRSAPPAAHFAYYFGAIPFWLGFLYFLSDMSHDAYAASHVTEGSLMIAILYVWNKSWQTVSASYLAATLSGRPGEPWTARRIARMVATQATIQPWGMALRPLAALATFPLVWVSAFFHNAVVLGDGSPAPISRSMAQAKLWIGQAHFVMIIVWIFTIFVWVNVFVAMAGAPFALKSLLGFESTFSRSMDAFFNTTFLTVTVALTSLAVDPLRRAVFVIRCFQGEAVKTAIDLSADLRRVGAPLRAALAALLLLAAAPLSAAADAPETPVEKPAAADARELDRRISEVLERREYAWRAPRARQAPGEKQGWLQEWINSIGNSLEKVLQRAFKAAGKIFDAIRKLFTTPASTGSGGNVDWAGLAKAFGILLLAGLLGLIVWLIVRTVRARKPRVVLATPATRIPDLTSEYLVADQLPEDGWLALARDHAAQGELALALRAAWLAGLAHLGHRELIAIARYKSNRDYHRELYRRARDRQPLLAAFDDNLSSFERSWYGKHEVHEAGYERFHQNLERIRAE
jgi:hypothetical protein